MEVCDEFTKNTLIHLSPLQMETVVKNFKKKDKKVVIGFCSMLL